MEWFEYVGLFVSAMMGGAVNSVAGGGTLLTFPALLWANQTEIIANATSTVALWPGQLGSLWGYRKEISGNGKKIIALAIPSFAGGLIGALLLLNTDNATFAAIVPYLILLATVLFMLHEPLNRWRNRRTNKGSKTSAAGSLSHTIRWLIVLGFQLLVAIYGGYFGAGIGILMLAAFGFLGLNNIHRMNALKNINSMAINLVAAILFIAKGLVDWRLSLLMAVGAIVGGYTGAGTAQKIGQKNVRRIIIVIGLALSVALLVRRVLMH